MVFFALAAQASVGRSRMGLMDLEASRSRVNQLFSPGTRGHQNLHSRVATPTSHDDAATKKGAKTETGTDGDRGEEVRL